MKNVWLQYTYTQYTKKSFYIIKTSDIASQQQ